MLHTYMINIRKNGDWDDAFAAACAACEAVFDDGAGKLFVLADDEKLEALAALRKLARSFRLNDQLADDFLIVHDGHGNSCLARKFAPYKDEPREPEDWIEHSPEDLQSCREQLMKTLPSGDARDAQLRTHIERAIAAVEAGHRIFVARDDDGYYFAFEGGPKK